MWENLVDFLGMILTWWIFVDFLRILTEVFGSLKTKRMNFACHGGVHPEKEFRVRCTVKGLLQIDF